MSSEGFPEVIRYADTLIVFLAQLWVSYYNIERVCIVSKWLELGNVRRLCASIVINIDLRTIGSNGGIFSDRYTSQIAFLENREEVQELEKPYKDKIGKDAVESIRYYRFGSGMTDKEQTELWRIEFASINIYQIKKWRLMKGGRAYYKEDASIMANSVDWKYDYRQALYDNGKVTIIMGDHDFLDFNAENHQKNLTNYPKVKIKVIKDAGHNIWVDEPGEFRKALKAALK